MNDAEVSKQVQQMVRFIRQEAEEKANEIIVSGEEEFNIERLQIVEAEKRKIRQEYERKEKQLEIKKRINYSMQLNASRLKVLQAQDDLVRGMKESAENKLAVVSSSADYKLLLKGLIVQGLLRLKEPSVLLRCRENDLELVNELLEDAKKEYLDKSGASHIHIQVDERKFLPPAQDPKAVGGQFCNGGVVLASKDGRIVCENTLDARLGVVFKQKLPEIRRRLFGSPGA